MSRPEVASTTVCYAGVSAVPNRRLTRRNRRVSPLAWPERVPPHVPADAPRSVRAEDDVGGAFDHVARVVEQPPPSLRPPTPVRPVREARHPFGRVVGRRRDD